MIKVDTWINTMLSAFFFVLKFMSGLRAGAGTGSGHCWSIRSITRSCPIRPRRSPEAAADVQRFLMSMYIASITVGLLPHWTTNTPVNNSTLFTGVRQNQSTVWSATITYQAVRRDRKRLQSNLHPPNYSRDISEKQRSFPQ